MGYIVLNRTLLVQRMAFNIDEEMSHFPCSFNLQTGRKISRERFCHARDKEMKELELKGSTIEEKIASVDLSSLELYGSILEEKIRGLNLLTWLLHKLKHVKEAEILNEKILQKTGNNNLTALGNRVFILFDQGYTRAVIKHCEELQQLTEKAESFEQIKYNALAEQAYSFSKLGGIENYKLSIQLYTECISKYPENYLWKYGLGMIYRRVTNYDLQFSNKDKLNVADITVKCQDLLNEVARNGDDRLRGHAYAQLAQLLHQDGCAHALEITKLVNEALKYGSNSSTVLTYCGMSVKKINTDQAIELLRASLQIKDIAMTYHHLGLSLLIKAESIKNNVNSPTESLNHDNKLNFDRGSLCRVKALREFVQSPCTTLDKENALVREAIQCFEKSLEVSHGENIPAKFDLAETHFKLNEFDTALKHYNIITRMLSSDYLVRKISAHEGAGRCLKELSKLPDKSDKLKNLAEDEFKKALSLAADLASKDPEYAGCETKVWQAFKRLMDDAEKLSSPDVKQKSTLKYLELAKNKDFERTIKQLLKKGLLQDFEMLRKGLDRLLEKGDYESALTFLSMASTRSVFTTNVSWSSEEFEALRSRTYILTAWDRLQKGSADSRRVFQQVFQLKYKQCIGMVSESEKDDQSDDQTSVSDVLIVNDDSADSEDAPDVTTSIAVTLRQVLKIVFGLEVTRNLERANNEHMKLELQLQEMKRYNVVVLLLGNNDAPDYNEMMKAVHAVGISRVLALSTRPLENVPLCLRGYQCIDMTKTEWKLTNQSPVSCGEDVCGFSEKDSRTEIIMKCFNGINEEVIKLFCLLVNEDFARYKPSFKTTEERIQVFP
ncbi:interferon-induced protein with tetratricopeptide repeats 5 [Biomphalaria pfeifferi]|uniref:Cell division cycle protein 27 homolog n=1 Tax=Biomphalaria pfeifferi TaxID=112525 RepID=A0AAD8BAH2_BIOPF|nr:interferon-induced protein with tetratricopeptide repeats 5 [Biomphalaria pfeifferi]